VQKGRHEKDNIVTEQLLKPTTLRATLPGQLSMTELTFCSTHLFHPTNIAINEQALTELNRPTGPAQLGGDQSPATTPEGDSHDMSPIMADADQSRGDGDKTNQQSPQGSTFDQQRQQSAAGNGDSYGTVGRSQGMGHTDTNGDEDRGYDQSGYRGGLGTSGGREDLSDRQMDTDRNPFVGGYDGGGSDSPTEAQTRNIGMNTPKPTGNSDDSPPPPKAS